MELKEVSISRIQFLPEDKQYFNIEDTESNFKIKNPYLLSVKGNEVDLYILLGRKLFLAARTLGYKTIKAYIVECDNVTEVTSIIETNESNSTTNLKRIIALNEKVTKLSSILDSETSKPIGRLKAIELAAREVGYTPETLRKYLRAADISAPAISKILGTKLENDKKTILKIAYKPKELHVQFVDAINNGLAFEEAVKQIEGLEKKRRDWPDDLDDIFNRGRRELLLLINYVSGTRAKTVSILSKYKDKKKSFQKYRAVKEINEKFKEVTALLELIMPYGPCPYCQFKGCEECHGDGWGTKELLLKAQAEGNRPIKFYFR